MPTLWDTVAQNNVFLQTPYLAVLEKSAPVNMECFYIGIFEHSNLIGVSLAQYLDLNKLESFGERDKSFKIAIRNFIFKNFASHTLFLGNNMITGQNGYVFTKDIDFECISDILIQSADEITLYFKKKGISIHLVSFKDFYEHCSVELKKFRFSNIYEFNTQPNMIFYLDEKWKSEEDYIVALSKKYRDQFKRARKKNDGIIVKNLSFEEVIHHENTIYDLYHYVAKNAPFNTFFLAKNHFSTLKGQCGNRFQIFGYFLNDKKDGAWRRYSLMGDLIARENYKGGYRDGKQQYFTQMGDILREESYKAVDPKNPYDTIIVPDLDHPDRMLEKVIKHEAAEVKNGTWTYYSSSTGDVVKTEKFVLKAQIHAGGRGKAGGVKILDTIEELGVAAKELLGKTLVTHQTGAEGREVKRLYVEESSNIDKEFYLSCLIDRASSKIVFISSDQGGMDIEEVADSTPEKIITTKVDIIKEISDADCEKIIKIYSLTDDAKKQAIALIKSVYNMFLGTDANMVEVNPLILTKEKNIICLDAKVNFDSNALFRHPEIIELRDLNEEDPAEIEASKHDLAYIKLDGSIGCMVNGAGLAMATMDIIKLYGKEPANFLDVGGGASKEKVSAALKISVLVTK